MITTKTGGKDSKNLSFNSNYGFQMPGRLIETMSHDQFIDYINSAYMNSKGTTVYNDEMCIRDSSGIIRHVVPH